MTAKLPRYFPLLLLLAVAAGVYARVLGHEFLVDWDDHLYVILNQDIRGISADHLRNAFTRFYVGNYAPLQIVSYMVDYTFWGMRPAGYFGMNLALHLVNGLLLHALVARVTGDRLWAFAAAAIFLLHPVQVESVAWVSQRKNVLSMAFFLWSLLLFLDWREGGGKPLLRYGGSIVTFACSLLAKPVAVIMPAVLLVYLLTIDRREKLRESAPALIPYAVIAGIAAALAVYTQGGAGAGGRTGYYGGSPWATFLTMIPVFCRYLGLLLWPADLSAIYLPQVRTSVDGTVALAAVLLAGVACGGVLLYRKRSPLFFWFALFFIGLVPVSQIVPIVTLMNDRYLYFPLLGGAGFLGGILSLAAARGGWRRTAAATAGAGVIIAFALLSWQRTGVWKNAFTLWGDTVKKVPRSDIAWGGMGNAMEHLGRLDEALGCYQRQLAVSPGSAEALRNIGITATRKGDIPLGRRHLLRLVELQPKQAAGFVYLGDNYVRGGDVAQGQESYRKALALDPDNRGALLKLGRLLTQTGSPEEARALLSRLTARYPESAEGFLALGAALYLAGETGQAEDAFRRASVLNPRSAGAFLSLGNISIRQGRLDAARQYYLKARESGEEPGEAGYALACVESLAGRGDEALKYLEEALRNGFRSRDRIERNRELELLRRQPGFQNLIYKYLGERSAP